MGLNERKALESCSEERDRVRDRDRRWQERKRESDDMSGVDVLAPTRQLINIYTPLVTHLQSRMG